ncbi:ATP-binding response regulator [Alkalispirochaeta americana]|uniref:ATP-binding response regulator n=1 Tax=Alkalispirochaeta americana TaxID=159291 RepID=UPI0013566398|nr:ATP-binding protein [Alkalispirochaeta americana]
MNDPFARRFGGVAEGAPLVLALSAGGGELCGWLPSGEWAQDKTDLETGALCPSLKVRFMALEGGECLFLCSGQAEDRAEQQKLSGCSSRIVPAFLRSTDHATFVVDERGSILAWNDLARDYALSGERLCGGRTIDQELRVSQYGRPVDTVGLVRETLRNGEDSRFGAGISLLTVRGASVQVELQVYPFPRSPLPLTETKEGQFRDETCLAEEFQGAVIAVVNTEERVRIRQDLAHVQHAQNILRATRGLAHDLTNACTSLFGHLEIIRWNTDEDVTALTAAVRKVQRLAHRFGAFSADSASRTLSSLSEGDPEVADQVEETLLNVVDLALSGTSIRATFDIQGPLEPLVLPPDLLGQALFNVITNAVEAMPEGGVLHVKAGVSREDHYVAITVRDEGHGMDSRTARDALQLYFSTKEGGTGMGLPVAVSLVEACGGRFSLSAEPGFGTTVTLKIPLKGEDLILEPERSGTHRQREDRRSLARLSVLLVEDDLLVRRSVERSLRVLGCSVTSVENGERALSLLQDQMREHEGATFDLLMTDLSMPGRINGIELLRRLREFYPALPALLSSGVLHDYHGSSYHEAGFQAVLRKPFGLDQLREAVQEAISTPLDPPAAMA